MTKSIPFKYQFRIHLAYYLKSLLKTLKIWQVSSKMKILSMTYYNCVLHVSVLKLKVVSKLAVYTYIIYSSYRIQVNFFK